MLPIHQVKFFDGDLKQTELLFSIRATRNKTAFSSVREKNEPLYVRNLYLRLDEVCRLEVDVVDSMGASKTPYKTLDFGDELLVFELRSTRQIELQFNLFCLRFGFRVVFAVSRVDADFTVCLSSEQLRQAIDLSFKWEHYNVIHVLPCASLTISNTDLLGETSLYLLFTHVNIAEGKYTCCALGLYTCCALGLSISFAQVLYSSLHEILIKEPTGQMKEVTGPFIVGPNEPETVLQVWHCGKGTYCHIMKTVKKNSSLAGVLNLSLNALHGDLDIHVLLKAPFENNSKIFRRQPALHLVFNYTLFASPWQHATHKRSYQDSQKRVYSNSIANTHYRFAFRKSLSWTTAVTECLSRGMRLLSTPSAVEWFQISALLALERDLMLLTRRTQLSYLVLESQISNTRE